MSDAGAWMGRAAPGLCPGESPGKGYTHGGPYRLSSGSGAPEAVRCTACKTGLGGLSPMLSLPHSARTRGLSTGAHVSDRHNCFPESSTSEGG